MKADRFSDSIRRKLESIRPEFTEKDWTRMQSTLHQATPPHPGPSVTSGGSMGAGHPWLLAAATVSTVVLMAVSVWQWRQINSLRQATEQLRQQNPAAQTTPRQEVPVLTGTGSLQKPETSQNAPVAPVPEQAAIRPRDTVYITRRVAVPQQTDVEPTKERSVQRTESPPEPRFADEADKPVLANKLRSTENKNSNTNPIVNGASSTSSIETTRSDLSTLTSNKHNEAVREQTATKQLSSSEKRRTDLNLSGSGSTADLAKGRISRIKGQRPTIAHNPVTDAPALGSRKSPASENAQPETVANQDNVPIEVEKVTIDVEQLASLPLSAEPKNWEAALTKRAKRIRLVQAATAVAQLVEKVPASQPVQVAPHFRAGIGGAVSSGVWSAGAFTEVLMGRHITLGLGLSKATHTSTFINDFDFEFQTKRDFRREFARGIDPKRDILTIETRVTRLEIPVNIGYRILLNQSFAFIPSIGTNLNLSSSEYISYYLPTYGPQHGFEKGVLTFSRSVAFLNSFQLAPSFEWQRGHWVVQGSPVFTIPLQAQQAPAESVPDWPQTALGLRARLLYQF